MEDIMKIDKFLKESGLLIKGASETFSKKVKEQKVSFFGMLKGKLVAWLLGNLLSSKRILRAGKGTIRAVKDF